jgi:hypothetical protein
MQKARLYGKPKVLGLEAHTADRATCPKGEADGTSLGNVRARMGSQMY